jgi:hypothetical protein
MKSADAVAALLYAAAPFGAVCSREVAMNRQLRRLAAFGGCGALVLVFVLYGVTRIGAPTIRIRP